MSDSELFGVDRAILTAPISDDQPAGVALAYEGVFDEIKDARREEDSTLPQGVWQRDLKVADWPRVKKMCLSALSEKTKDLQIAAWLSEAMLKLDGIAGAAAAVDLVADLCERHWEHLYPLVEDGDFDMRMAPLVWMDRVIAERLSDVPLCDSGPKSDLAYGFGDWEEAAQRDVMRQAGKLTEADLEGQVTKDQITATWSMTRAGFYERRLTELERLVAGSARLGRVLQDKAGDEAPALRKIKERAAKLERILRRASSAAIPDEVEVESEPEDAEETEHAELAPAAEAHITGLGAGRTIHSRAEAYRRLAEVAEYLIRTEPHSPAGYLVNRAVAWGDMRLSDLLEEIVGDPTDLAGICTLLGISRREDDAEETS